MTARPSRRINLGCGPHYAAGWLNVDLPGVGVQADRYFDLAQGLPFPDGWADQVYMGHVIEHLRLPTVVDVLRSVRRVLRTDGELLVVAPDATRCSSMQELTLALGLDTDRFDEPGGPHEWVPTEGLVTVLLHRAGFSARQLRVTPEVRSGLTVAAELPLMDEWPVVSYVGWQCAVLGR